MMYTIASCYVSGPTSALHGGFLLRLVYRFSKPERSNSRDKKSVKIIVEHVIVEHALILKSSRAPRIRMEKKLQYGRKRHLF